MHFGWDEASFVLTSLYFSSFDLNHLDLADPCFWKSPSNLYSVEPSVPLQFYSTLHLAFIRRRQIVLEYYAFGKEHPSGDRLAHLYARNYLLQKSLLPCSS